MPVYRHICTCVYIYLYAYTSIYVYVDAYLTKAQAAILNTSMGSRDQILRDFASQNSSLIVSSEALSPGKKLGRYSGKLVASHLAVF